MKLPTLLVACFYFTISHAFAQTICNPIIVENTSAISGALACSPPPCANAMIITRGYTTADDGGGAEYVVVVNPSSPTSGIDFLICSNGGDDYYAMFNYQGSIIAEQAGLIGDGSTDNWARLKTLCQYLGSTNDAVLYLTPDRTYNVVYSSGTNYMTPNFKLDGRGASIFMEDVSYLKTLFYFNSYAENIRIENVVFEGAPSTTEDYFEHATYSNNWEVFRFNAGVNDVTFDNVVFKKNFKSVTCQNGGDEIRFNNCDFIDNSMQLGTGGMKRVTIDNCLFDQTNVLLNETYAAEYKHYHHIYVSGTNLIISNTKFNQKVGEGIKTVSAATLMLNNVEFDNAGRIYTSTDEVFVNNVKVENTLDFMHLETTSDCFINNLTYSGPIGVTTGLPIWGDGTDSRLFVTNSLFSGSMKFYFNGFREYNMKNVTILNPCIGGSPVFTQNVPGKCDVKFDNVRVEIDQIATDATHVINNDALFRISYNPGYNISLNVVNSQFLLSDALTGFVHLIGETGNEGVLFHNVGLKGFGYPFLHTGPAQNNMRSELLYDITTNEPHPMQHVVGRTFNLTTYLHKYVNCGANITVTLGDGAPQFHEVTIDPNNFSISVTTPPGSSTTIDGHPTLPYSIGSTPTTYVRIGNKWFVK